MKSINDNINNSKKNQTYNDKSNNIITKKD